MLNEFVSVISKEDKRENIEDKNLSLMHMHRRNKTGSNIDPLGTPLVFGCNKVLWQPNWVKIHTFFLVPIKIAL